MKKMLILLFCFLTVRTFAQTEPTENTVARTEFQAKQIIPPAPIAAELGKYGNTPVSLFTGTPISVRGDICMPQRELP